MGKLLDNEGIFEGDDFVIFQANSVEIVKGSGEKGNDDRLIHGYCSTEHLDRQKEVVLQKGLDFSDFVKHGYFNDNHNQATAAVVGIPDTAEYHPGKGWHTTGKLLKGFQLADGIWNLAKSLVGTKRRLGFSIEGKVMERRGNYITKAKIRNVAITNCPVNPNCTWDILAKSFDAKAMSVGHDVVPTTGGRVHVPQDLEHDEVKQVWKCATDGCKKFFRSEAGLTDHMKAHGTGKKSTRKSDVNEAEAVAILKSLRPHLSEDTCRKIFHYSLKGA